MATITQIRAVSLVIVLCVACYAGVDVVPGSLDFQGEFEPTEGFKTSDFSLDDLGDGPERVVRLQNQDGQPITEAQEDELRSLLERLEQAFIADDLAKINFNKKLIKKKQACRQFALHHSEHCLSRPCRLTTRNSMCFSVIASHAAL
eukprot:SAG31_NODE_1480_length_8180_cov_5.458978_12_plen_147_part_00